MVTARQLPRYRTHLLTTMNLWYGSIGNGPSSATWVPRSPKVEGLHGRPGVERRLAAILAADVVGYSRLMAADERGTHARLKALRKDFIAPEIAEHRGRS